MPFATNAADGTRVYFEDDGGPGAPVVVYGGILDTVELVGEGSPIARALQAFSDEFRLIYADHRGLGRSDKPHDLSAYAMGLQSGDAVAVLDELDIARAHVVGGSYGGRLCFGIGEHAPERVLSLVAGGQQPFAIDRDRPLSKVILAAVERTRREGIAAFVEALEDYWSTRFPEPARSRYLEQDGDAVAAAAEALFTQDDISRDLRAWRVPCLIYLGEADVDFVDGARRAAKEIPRAKLVTLDDLDHLGAHYESGQVIPAMLSTLRRSEPRG